MVPARERQLGVDNAGLDTELAQEQLEAVPALNVVDKDDRLAADELEFEKDVDEQELVLFRGVGKVLREERGCFGFGQGQNGLHVNGILLSSI